MDVKMVATHNEKERNSKKTFNFCDHCKTLAAGLAITSFSLWQEPVGKTPSDAIPFRSSLHNTCYERRHSPFHSEDALQYIIRLYISWLRRLKTGFDRTRRPCDRPNLTSLSEEPIYIRYALYTSYIYTRCIYIIHFHLYNIHFGRHFHLSHRIRVNVCSFLQLPVNMFQLKKGQGPNSMPKNFDLSNFSSHREHNLYTFSFL